jgi:hypothetical protein
MGLADRIASLNPIRTGGSADLTVLMGKPDRIASRDPIRTAEAAG